MIKFTTACPFDEEAFAVTGNWEEKLGNAEDATQEYLPRLRVDQVSIEVLPWGGDNGEEEGAGSGLLNAMAKIPRSAASVYVTSREIVAKGAEGGSMCIPYTSIILHSLMSSGNPRVYCQVEFNGYEGEDGETIKIQDEAAADDDNDSPVFLEIMLIPAQEGQAEELYNAICDCAVLHPSLDDLSDLDEEHGDLDDDDDEREFDGEDTSRSEPLDEDDATRDDLVDDGSNKDEDVEEEEGSRSKEPRIDH